MLSAISILLESATAVCEELVIRFLNGTFYQPPYIPCAGSTILAGFNACMRSMVMILLSDINKITGDFISAWIVGCFTTRN